MFNLIRLEHKKFKFSYISKGTIIANTVMLALLVMIAYIGEIENDRMCSDVGEWISAINVLAMATFVIYGSVILSKLVISEYQTKTIQLMFMYPIDRKKLLLSKLLMVYLFTVINVALSNVFLIMSMAIINQLITIVPETFSLDKIIEAVPNIITSIICSGFLAVIPLYFGMRKKSTVHTIVAAVIVACLTCSSGSGTMALSVYLIRFLITGAIAAIGFLVTIGHALNNLDSVDMD